MIRTSNRCKNEKKNIYHHSIGIHTKSMLYIQSISPQSKRQSALRTIVILCRLPPAEPREDSPSVSPLLLIWCTRRNALDKMFSYPADFPAKPISRFPDFLVRHVSIVDPIDLWVVFIFQWALWSTHTHWKWYELWSRTPNIEARSRRMEPCCFVVTVKKRYIESKLHGLLCFILTVLHFHMNKNMTYECLNPKNTYAMNK